MKRRHPLDLRARGNAIHPGKSAEVVVEGMVLLQEEENMLYSVLALREAFHTGPWRAARGAEALRPENPVVHRSRHIDDLPGIQRTELCRGDLDHEYRPGSFILDRRQLAARVIQDSSCLFRPLPPARCGPGLPAGPPGRRRIQGMPPVRLEDPDGEYSGDGGPCF